MLVAGHKQAVARTLGQIVGAKFRKGERPLPAPLRPRSYGLVDNYGADVAGGHDGHNAHAVVPTLGQMQ